MKANNRSSVRQFEGIENLEDFIEIFEAFASDLITQFSTLSLSVQTLHQSFDALAKALDTTPGK